MNEVKPKQASWVVQKIFNAGKYIEEAGLTVEEIMSRDMFSIRKMYNNMRGDYPRVHWRRLICNNQSSPRWSFILYMTVQNRLYTRDKLIKQGMQSSPICILCEQEQETTQHLFFECNIAARIWQKLLTWQGVSRVVMGWSEEVTCAINNARGKYGKA